MLLAIWGNELLIFSLFSKKTMRDGDATKHAMSKTECLNVPSVCSTICVIQRETIEKKTQKYSKCRLSSSNIPVHTIHNVRRETFLFLANIKTLVNSTLRQINSALEL